MTPASGRHGHLRAQQRHLAELAPDLRVVVAMGDPQIEAVVAETRCPGQIVVPMPVPSAPGRGLPLARARNLGIAVALERGADLAVLLDVDCLPGSRLLSRYDEAAAVVGRSPALLCGPVTYLPAEAGAPTPAELAEWTRPHDARPAPAPGEVVRGGDHRLFWSLSFAVTRSTWARLGGFHEGYDGYGGEDTDLGFTARERGVDLVWVGGAHAYHQHHPVSSPPVEHLDSILRNATIFHERWGVWPMEGWLTAFAEMGLAEYDGRRWIRSLGR